MQKQKLTKLQKEKLLLTFLHTDYKINKEQYHHDLDLLNQECARYYAMKGNSVRQDEYQKNKKFRDKWINIRTHEWWWKSKHILRSEYENFKTLIA